MDFEFDYDIDNNGNAIHMTARVHERARLGKNNVIGAFCMVYENVTMGDNNHFQSHCSIGAPPQHKAFDGVGNNKGVSIGNNNKFREFVTIHGGTSITTTIGNGNYLMAYCHIPHDAILGDDITMANGTQLGGHTVVQNRANFGLNSVVHQFGFIGEGAMLGMGCVVSKNKRIIPYWIHIGNPARATRKNLYLLEKYGVDEKTLAELIERYNKDFSYTKSH